jgi:hypothetical protein
MRMGASLMKDKRGTGVGMTTHSFATVPVASLAVSSLNCIANKARDQVWKLGDQAMKKVTGSCFQ